MKRTNLLLALALWLCAARASAEPSAPDTFALNWVREPGAEGCVSSRALSRMLEKVTGPVLRTEEEATLSVECSVRRDAARGFQVRIRVLNRAGTAIGERELSTRGPECSALTQSVLLVIAMIVSPESVERGLPNEVLDQLSESRRQEALAQVTDTTPTPPAEPQLDSQPKSPERAIAPSPRARVEALGALLLGYGFVPGFTPGVRVGARVTTLRGWSASLAGDLWAPRNVAVDTLRTLDGGVDFGAVHLASALCGDLLAARRFAFGACAGGIVGARWADARALASRSGELTPYVALTLGTEARFELSSRWALRAGATTLLSLARQRFMYRDYQGDEHALFEPSHVASLFHLELGASL